MLNFFFEDGYEESVNFIERMLLPVGGQYIASQEYSPMAESERGRVVDHRADALSELVKDSCNKLDTVHTWFEKNKDQAECFPQSLSNLWSETFDWTYKLIESLKRSELSNDLFGRLVELTNNGFYALSEIRMRYHPNRTVIHEKLDDFWQALWQIKDVCSFQLAITKTEEKKYKATIFDSSVNWERFAAEKLIDRSALAQANEYVDQLYSEKAK